MERFHLAHRLLPIRGFRNDFKCFSLEQGLQTLTYQDMVISEHHANWHVQPPMEVESKVQSPARGPIRCAPFRRWHSIAPACRSALTLSGGLLLEQHERQNPLRRPGSSTTTRPRLATRGPRYCLPFHA